MRHELHLMASGLRAVVVAVPVLVVVGLLTSGTRGAASVAAGAAIVIANQVLAVASTAWSRRLDRRVLVTGYAGWVVRMVGVLAALVVIGSMPWVERWLVATSFCVTLVVLLSAECVGYLRGSYVPAWRMAR